MSHYMNDLAHEQRQDLYWDTYDDLIAKGYDAGVAEDMALAIVGMKVSNIKHRLLPHLNRLPAHAYWHECFPVYHRQSLRRILKPKYGLQHRRR